MGLFGSSFNQADPSGYLMNIGGQQQPQNPWEMAMQPTQQQAAQQFQQQYNQPIGNMQAQALPVDPRAAQAARPGFFGKGGRGWGILGVIGDGLQVAGGGRATYQDYMRQQDEYAQRLKELQAERAARREELVFRHDLEGNDPQAVNLGNGGFGVWSPNGGLQVQREPQQDIPDWQQYARVMGDPNISQEEKRLYQDGYLKGYGPTATGYRQEVKQTVPGKAPSAGGGRARTKTINGMTFYNVGGKWYDNPEGR